MKGCIYECHLSKFPWIKVLHKNEKRLHFTFILPVHVLQCTCIIFLGTVAGTIYIDPYARDDKLDRSYYEMGRGKI